jgi:Mrp family chromosome partitioning ATPase
MTALDRAFIKAYADVTPRPADAGPSAEAPRPTIAGETSAAETGRPAPGAAAAAIDHLEPPDLSESDARSSPLPLSSFASQPKVDDSFRALLEIDRAEWPTACGDLLVRAGRDWDRFGEQLIERMSQGQKCVALSSAARGDGRTTVSLALAKHVAGRGLRPVVVDADPENPTLVRSCGVSVHTGWDDLVASELPLGEALITAVDDGVTLMPWRGAAVSGSQLAQSPRIASIFGTLREHYDLVLLDTMPLADKMTITQFAALAAAIHLDALYLIQNVRSASREELSITCSLLRRAGLPLAAIIENFVSPETGENKQRPGEPPLAGRNLAIHGS